MPTIARVLETPGSQMMNRCRATGCTRPSGRERSLTALSMSAVCMRTRLQVFTSKLAHRSAPFLMYVGFNSPHDPRQAPSEYLERYPTESIEIPPNYLPEHPFDQGDARVRDELLAPFSADERSGTTSSPRILCAHLVHGRADRTHPRRAGELRQSSEHVRHLDRRPWSGRQDSTG